MMAGACRGLLAHLSAGALAALQQEQQQGLGGGGVLPGGGLAGAAAVPALNVRLPSIQDLRLA